MSSSTGVCSQSSLSSRRPRAVEAIELGQREMGTLAVQQLLRRTLLGVGPLGSPPPLFEPVRSLNGRGNNAYYPCLGSALTPMERLTPPPLPNEQASAAWRHRPACERVSEQLLSGTGTESAFGDRPPVLDPLWQAWGAFLADELVQVVPPSALTSSVKQPSSRRPCDRWPAPSNQMTAFIDGSSLYGVCAEQAVERRCRQGGLVHLEPLLGTPAVGAASQDELGLRRLLQRLWLAEHNRLAAQFSRQAPQLSDEQLYQAARKHVGAQLQAITYFEYLPLLLGRQTLPAYEGYQACVDPSISLEFALVVAEPWRLTQVAKPEAQQRLSEVLELARSLGGPSFNCLRAALGLRPLMWFEHPQFTAEGASMAKLYSDIDAVDALVGCWIERPVSGAALGETALAVLVDQCVRLRAGDAHWFEREFAPEQRRALQQTRLLDVVARHGSLQQALRLSARAAA